MTLFIGEGCVNKSGDEFLGQRISHDAGSEYQNIGVVVLHTLVCRIRIVAQAGSNADQLVGRNRCSYATAANEDAPFGLAVQNCLTYRLCVIGIIDGSRGISSDIDHLVFLIAEEVGNGPLQFEPSMISADDNAH